MVAHHYVNALELIRAADGADDALAERTVRALSDAGDRALALNALAQAAGYYRQAVALSSEDAELLMRYGRVLYLQDSEGEDELTEARARLLAADKREAGAAAQVMLAD